MLQTSAAAVDKTETGSCTGWFKILFSTLNSAKSKIVYLQAHA